MLSDASPTVKKIAIHTGNLLNLNELKIRAGQTPKDELLESLNLVISRSKALKTSENALQIDGGNPLDGVDDPEERKDLKTSLKLFIPSSGVNIVQEAVESAFAALGNQEVDSLIIAYNDHNGMKTFLSNLEALWKVCERYVEQGKVLRIGVSDVDTEDFISLYNNANIKPSIVQINLSACCVVPPQLQEFTKQHDIQLLTHNDPMEMLPDKSFSQLFHSNDARCQVTLSWAIRYQIHVKCRGVLCSKGYLISAQKI